MIHGHTENDQKADEALVEAAIAALVERFPAVQVMCSRVSEDTGEIKPNTVTVIRGSGDWNARMGMAHYFINTEEHMDRVNYERRKESFDE